MYKLFAFDRNTWNHMIVQTNDYHSQIKQLKNDCKGMLDIVMIDSFINVWLQT